MDLNKIQTNRSEYVGENLFEKNRPPRAFVGVPTYFVMKLFQKGEACAIPSKSAREVRFKRGYHKFRKL